MKTTKEKKTLRHEKQSFDKTSILLDRFHCWQFDDRWFVNIRASNTRQINPNEQLFTYVTGLEPTCN